MSDPAPHVVTHKEMVAALLEVTGWRIPAKSGAQIGKLAKDLLAAGVFPHDILYRFGTTDPGEGWWYWRDFWLGKRGERPNEYALRECAGKWTLATAVQLPVSEPAGYAALRALREARAER